MVVGEADKGWTCAKAVLGFERIAIGSPKLCSSGLARLKLLAEEAGVSAEPEFVAAFIRHCLDLADLKALYESIVAAVKRGDRRHRLGHRLLLQDADQGDRGRDRRAERAVPLRRDHVDASLARRAIQGGVARLTQATTGTITPAIDAFFAGGEDAIKAFFDQLRTELTQGDQISSVRGMGATTHSAFTFGLSGGAPTSHATQCSYGLQKLKAAPSASGTTLVTAVGDSPLADFFTIFAGRLGRDGDLAAAVGQFKSDFSGLVNAHSARDFLSSLLLTLPGITETLLIGALAVANALIDGFLAVTADAITAVMGILTTEIEIPFLTWLYETVFAEKLTFLNLVTLVAVIPITIIFRVVEGKWRSTAGLPALGAMQASRAGVAPKLVQRIFGILTGILAMAQGLVNGLGDAMGDDAAPILSKITVGIGLFIAGFSYPLIYADAGSLSSLDWATYGIGVSRVLLKIGGIPSGDGDEDVLLSKRVLSVLTSILGCAALAVVISASVKHRKMRRGSPARLHHRHSASCAITGLKPAARQAARIAS